MTQFDNLCAKDQAKVDAKLAELNEKTGKCWGYEVTKEPERCEGTYFLEIRIDGHISRPVVLNGEDAKPAERICSELDWAYTKRY